MLVCCLRLQLLQFRKSRSENPSINPSPSPRTPFSPFSGRATLEISLDFTLLATHDVIHGEPRSKLSSHEWMNKLFYLSVIKTLRYLGCGFVHEDSTSKRFLQRTHKHTKHVVSAFATATAERALFLSVTVATRHYTFDKHCTRCRLWWELFIKVKYTILLLTLCATRLKTARELILSCVLEI